jgi:hypothetical protein
VKYDGAPLIVASLYPFVCGRQYHPVPVIPLIPGLFPVAFQNSELLNPPEVVQVRRYTKRQDQWNNWSQQDDPIAQFDQLYMVLLDHHIASL